MYVIAVAYVLLLLLLHACDCCRSYMHINAAVVACMHACYCCCYMRDIAAVACIILLLHA